MERFFFYVHFQHRMSNKLNYSLALSIFVPIGSFVDNGNKIFNLSLKWYIVRNYARAGNK